jgi:hypothetical protein
MHSTRYFLLFFGVITNLICFGQYSKVYQDEFRKGNDFFNEKRAEFKKLANDINIDERFIFSIVAPEIGHFNLLKNSLESNSLKVLYVQFGSQYSDFSIGPFQMKPSFIERCEKQISQDTFLLSKYAKCLIATKDTRTNRIERIRRLETLEWQMIYLSIFIEIVDRKFKLKFNSVADELKFYSTVYNTGFQKSMADIEHEYTRKRFPNMSDQKFNYSSVSLEYYQFLMQ